MSNTNCLPRMPALPQEDCARLNCLDGDWPRKELRCRTATVSFLPQGRKSELFLIEGSGALRTLFIELTGETPEAAACATLSFFVDGEGGASVRGPIQDLFLSGREGRAVYGDYAGKTAGANGGRGVSHYRYLLVPFTESLRVELEAAGGGLRDVVVQVYCQMDREGKSTDYGRYNRAHSAERIGRETELGREVELARVGGRGVLHSFQLSMANPQTRGPYLEGNIEVYVDGEAFPNYQTSGTEEFFMGGVYFMSLHETAYSGCTRTFNDGRDNSGNVCSAHRLFIEDPIPFDRELRICWHNGEAGQGEVAGATDYDFHGVYYLDEGVPPAPEAPMDEIEARLQALDHGADGAENRCVSFRGFLEAGDTTIAEVKGSGSASLLYLQLDDDASGGMEIGFAIDGRNTGFVPLGLFFHNGSGHERYVGQTAGCTGEGTYFRYLNIPYRESFAVVLKSARRRAVSGRIEHRKCCAAAMEEYGQEGWSGHLSAGRSAVLAEFTGRGRIKELVFEAEGAGPPDGEFLVYTDGSPQPAIASVNIPRFFLSGSDASAIEGAADQVGVRRQNGRFTAFRLFDNDPVTFRSGVKVVFTARSAMKVSSAVSGRILPDSHPRSGMNVNDAARRLNLLDGGSVFRYGRCHTAMEAERGSIGPGGTSVLFEDFGPGAVRCIRLGTPLSAPALLAANLRVYAGGEAMPCIDTTVERFFSAPREAPLFWYNGKYLANPSRVEKEEPFLRHVSVYRYLLLPYREGLRMTLTAPPDRGIGSGFLQVYWQGGKSTAIDFGSCERLTGCSFTGAVAAGEEALLASVRGRGRLESVQMLLDNEKDGCWLDGDISITIDGAAKHALVCPLSAFFLAPVERTDPQTFLDGYTEFWRKARRMGQGGFTSACAGWPIRTCSPPFRAAAYRLFRRDPVVFAQSLEIRWRNSARSATAVKADALVYMARPEE